MPLIDPLVAEVQLQTGTLKSQIVQVLNDFRQFKTDIENSLRDVGKSTSSSAFEKVGSSAKSAQSAIDQLVEKLRLANAITEQGIKTGQSYAETLSNVKVGLAGLKGGEASAEVEHLTRTLIDNNESLKARDKALSDSNASFKSVLKQQEETLLAANAEMERAETKHQAQIAKIINEGQRTQTSQGQKGAGGFYKKQNEEAAAHVKAIEQRMAERNRAQKTSDEAYLAELNARAREEQQIQAKAQEQFAASMRITAEAYREQQRAIAEANFQQEEAERQHQAQIAKLTTGGQKQQTVESQGSAKDFYREQDAAIAAHVKAIEQNLAARNRAQKSSDEAYVAELNARAREEQQIRAKTQEEFAASMRISAEAYKEQQRAIAEVTSQQEAAERQHQAQIAKITAEGQKQQTVEGKGTAKDFYREQEDAATAHVKAIEQNLAARNRAQKQSDEAYIAELNRAAKEQAKIQADLEKQQAASMRKLGEEYQKQQATLARQFQARLPLPGENLTGSYFNNLGTGTANVFGAGTIPSPFAHEVEQSMQSGFQKMKGMIEEVTTAGQRMSAVFGDFFSNLKRIAEFSVGAGIVVQTFFAIQNALTNIVSSGISFNAEMEKTQISIAALLTQSRQLVSTTGEVGGQLESYPLFLEKAKGLQKDLLLLDATTLGTGKELQDVFRIVLAFTQTQNAKDKERLELTANILNASKLVGLEGEQSLVEARQMLTLERDQGQQILQSLGIRAKELRIFRDQGGLVQKLNELLKVYTILSSQLGLSWEGITTSVTTFFDILKGQAFENTFSGIKDILTGVYDEIKKISDAGGITSGLTASSAQLRQLGANLADLSANVIKFMADATNSLLDFAAESGNALKPINAVFSGVTTSFGGLLSLLGDGLVAVGKFADALASIKPPSWLPDAVRNAGNSVLNSDFAKIAKAGIGGGVSGVAAGLLTSPATGPAGPAFGGFFGAVGGAYAEAQALAKERAAIAEFTKDGRDKLGALRYTLENLLVNVPAHPEFFQTFLKYIPSVKEQMVSLRKEVSLLPDSFPEKSPTLQSLDKMDGQLQGLIEKMQKANAASKNLFGEDLTKRVDKIVEDFKDVNDQIATQQRLNQAATRVQNAGGDQSQYEVDKARIQAQQKVYEQAEKLQATIDEITNKIAKNSNATLDPESAKTLDSLLKTFNISQKALEGHALTVKSIAEASGDAAAKLTGLEQANEKIVGSFGDAAKAAAKEKEALGELTSQISATDANFEKNLSSLTHEAISTLEARQKTLDAALEKQKAELSKKFDQDVPSDVLAKFEELRAAKKRETFAESLKDEQKYSDERVTLAEATAKRIADTETAKLQTRKITDQSVIDDLSFQLKQAEAAAGVYGKTNNTIADRVRLIQEVAKEETDLLRIDQQEQQVKVEQLKADNAILEKEKQNLEERKRIALDTLGTLQNNLPAGQQTQNTTFIDKFYSDLIAKRQEQVDKNKALITQDEAQVDAYGKKISRVASQTADDVNKISSTILHLNDPIANFLSNLFDGFQKGALSFKSVFKTLQGDLSSAFSNAFKEIIKKKLSFDFEIKDNVGGLGDFITGTFGDAFGGVGKLFSSFGQSVSGFFSNIFSSNAGGNGSGGFLSSITNLFGSGTPNTSVATNLLGQSGGTGNVSFLSNLFGGQLSPGAASATASPFSGWFGGGGGSGGFSGLTNLFGKGSTLGGIFGSPAQTLPAGVAGPVQPGTGIFSGGGGSGNLFGGLLGGVAGNLISGAFGIGQSKPGKLGGQIGGLAGGIGGGVAGGALLGAQLGAWAGPIGAAVGAALGVILGGVLGDLLKPGRIATEKKGIQESIKATLPDLPHKVVTEPVAAAGLRAQSQVAPSLFALGLQYASTQPNATPGTEKRYAAQLAADLTASGASAKTAQEDILKLASAMKLDLNTGIESVNKAMTNGILSLSAFQKNLADSDKNLKKFGATSDFTVKQLNDLATANGNTGSRINTVGEALAGVIDIVGGFDQFVNGTVIANNYLADSFEKVAHQGGVFNDALDMIDKKIRSGDLSLEEGVNALNKYRKAAGLTAVDLSQFSIDSTAIQKQIDQIKASASTIRSAFAEAIKGGLAGTSQGDIATTFKKTIYQSLVDNIVGGMTDGFLKATQAVAPLTEVIAAISELTTKYVAGDISQTDLFTQIKEKLSGSLPIIEKIAQAAGVTSEAFKQMIASIPELAKLFSVTPNTDAIRSAFSDAIKSGLAGVKQEDISATFKKTVYQGLVDNIVSGMTDGFLKASEAVAPLTAVIADISGLTAKYIAGSISQTDLFAQIKSKLTDSVPLIEKIAQAAGTTAAALKEAFGSIPELASLFAVPDTAAKPFTDALSNATKTALSSALTDGLSHAEISTALKGNFYQSFSDTVQSALVAGIINATLTTGPLQQALTNLGDKIAEFTTGKISLDQFTQNIADTIDRIAPVIDAIAEATGIAADKLKEVLSAKGFTLNTSQAKKDILDLSASFATAATSGFVDGIIKGSSSEEVAAAIRKSFYTSIVNSVASAFVQGILQAASSQGPLKAASRIFNELFSDFGTGKLSQGDFFASVAQLFGQIAPIISSLASAVGDASTQFSALLGGVGILNDVIDQNTTAQQDATTAATDAAQAQKDAAQAAADLAHTLRQSAKDLLLDPSLSPLKPKERVTQAEVNFEHLVADALAGNKDAAKALPEAGKSLLGEARKVFASGAGYEKLFDYVRGSLLKVADFISPAVAPGDEQLATLKDIRDQLKIYGQRLFQALSSQGQFNGILTGLIGNPGPQDSATTPTGTSPGTPKPSPAPKPGISGTGKGPFNLSDTGAQHDPLLDVVKSIDLNVAMIVGILNKIEANTAKCCGTSKIDPAPPTKPSPKPYGPDVITPPTTGKPPYVVKLDGVYYQLWAPSLYNKYQDPSGKIYNSPPPGVQVKSIKAGDIARDNAQQRAADNAAFKARKAAIGNVAPYVASMREGGIVTAKEMQAVLHGPEMVIPLPSANGKIEVATPALLAEVRALRQEMAKQRSNDQPLHVMLDADIQLGNEKVGKFVIDKVQTALNKGQVQVPKRTVKG